jgi:Protein of unknown function (DUF3102)
MGGDSKRRKTVALASKLASTTDWAKLINEEYDKYQQAFDEAIAYAQSAWHHIFKCGEYPTNAKAEVGHGGWGKWQERNLKFSQEKASLYMKFYEYKTEISNAVTKSPEMTLNEARKLLPQYAPRGRYATTEEKPKAEGAEGNAGSGEPKQPMAADGATGEASGGPSATPSRPTTRPITVKMVKGMVAKFDDAALQIVAAYVAGIIEERERLAA